MLNSEWNFTSPSPELSTIEPPPTPVMWWGGLTQVFQLVWHKDSVSAVMRWTDRSLGCVWHKDRVSAVTRWTVLVSDTRTVSVLWRGGLTQVSGQCLTQGQGQCCDEVDWHRPLTQGQGQGHVWHKDGVSAVMRWTAGCAAGGWRVPQLCPESGWRRREWPLPVASSSGCTPHLQNQPISESCPATEKTAPAKTKTNKKQSKNTFCGVQNQSVSPVQQGRK